MSHEHRPNNSGRGRNRRFLDNLQQQMGGGGRGRLRPQPQGRPPVPQKNLPQSFDEFMDTLGAPKLDQSLTDLAYYYKQNYAQFSEEEVTKIAEKMFFIGYGSDSMYDFVGFLNVAFADDRFQDRFTQEFVVLAAILFDEPDPNLTEYEKFGGFVGHMLKTRFARPFHLIVEHSNKLLVAIMNILLGMLNEIPELLGANDTSKPPLPTESDSDDDESETSAPTPPPTAPKLSDDDVSLLKCKATAIVCAVKVMNRRLFLDHFELNDNIYKVLRIVLCESDGLALGKDFRRLVLSTIIDIEKFSVVGAKNSTTEVGTQTSRL